jgi:glycosyltransferase involved in cell wall biosynthesis
MKNKVTCIIPAYNEGSRIARVLKVVVNHPLIGEVIVIDDCSKDNTLKVVKDFSKVTILRNKQNKGKTFSLMRGLYRAKNDIILLLDADLSNISKENISQLIMPILNKEAGVSIALVKGTGLIFELIGVDPASGQRVVNKAMINIKRLRRMKGYGFEIFMNNLIIQKKVRVKIINWLNVNCASKGAKLGKIRAIRNYFYMWGQMIKTGGLKNFFFQTYYLSLLRV